MKASVADLRYRLENVLAALDRGEEVTLTYRGQERARLSPVAKKAKFDPEERLRQLLAHPAVGMWKDREDMKDPTAYISKLRESRYDAFGFRRDDLGVQKGRRGSGAAGTARKPKGVSGDADGSAARRRVRG